MGTMNLAMFAGMGLGPFIGGSLTDIFSMNTPFYVMGALTAISLLLLMILLPDDRQRQMTADRPAPSFKEVLSNKLLRAAFVYRAVGALGRGSIMSFLSMYISGTPEIGGLGIPLTMAGLILSVGQVSAALLQRPFGVLADKYSKVNLILLGGVVGACGMALFPFTNNSWEVMAARLVFSVGSSIGMPALTAIVAIEGRDMGIGTTMSVLQTAMSLGMIAGPMLSGLIGDAFGLKPVFLFGSVIMMIGTAAFFLLQRSTEPSKE